MLLRLRPLLQTQRLRKDPADLGQVEPRAYPHPRWTLRFLTLPLSYDPTLDPLEIANARPWRTSTGTPSHL